jgi:hypothetical protein
MRKTFLGEVSFWLHMPIFAFVVLPFLIPTALWPNVVMYHFWYIVGLYVLGYSTGALYHSRTQQYLFMCPLTLLTQRLRGCAWSSPKTYRGSFIGELWERLGFTRLEGNKSNFNAASLIMHAMLLLVVIQYTTGLLTL